MSRHYAVFFLILISIPFGIALQGGLSLVVTLMVLRLPVIRRSTSWWLRLLWGLPVALCLWDLIATALNPANTSRGYLGYFLGYLPLSLIPYLLYSRVQWHPEWTSKLEKTLCWLCFGWGLMVASQWLLGWSLHHPSGGVDYRPKGFYSHTLTLAYVGLLMLPVVLRCLLTQPRKIAGYLGTAGILMILYSTQSRACQSVALAIIITVFFLQLQGRRRWLALAFVVASVAVVAFTDNPASQRFAVIGQDSNPDRFSEYPDDRLAFWHAHWQMVLERPIIGHGIHLDHRYRIPYYEQIGLADFIKQYEAHNQYLQEAARGGLIGLVLFLAWLLVLLRSSRGLRSDYRLYWALCLLAFMISGTVQNAYSDGEVRHTLMVLIAISLVIYPKSTADARLARGETDSLTGLQQG